MKKKIIALGISVITMLSMTACGESSYSDYKNSDSLAVSNEANVEFNGWDESSRIDFNNEMVDYGYTFKAGGDISRKKKDAITEYFTNFQELVKANDGYVDSYVNDFHDYKVLDYSSYISSEKTNFEFTGTVHMEVEVPNENVDNLIKSLNGFCEKNKLTVTDYTQTATNYENYTVVSEEVYDEEDDWYYDDHEIISQQEMDRRLKYSELSIEIKYWNERATLTKQWIATRELMYEFNSSIVSIIWALIIFALFSFVFSRIVVINVVAFRKKQYKTRMKHPEYFSPKELVLINKGEEVKEVKDTSEETE